MIGQTVGHYQILESIGAGGMGEVYRAHDETLDRDVALKVLPADNFRDATARARLLREARLAAGLNHPHICTVHEVGEAEGQAYIVMELIHGQPLSKLVPGEGLPSKQLLDYGLQLTDALAHAHEHGVVHRDLKCANVMVTTEGRIKVLDFGLAKRQLETSEEEATLSEATLTRAGEFLGTLPYMAPELLHGQGPDVHSDVWALGVMLYEMAGGVRPFRGRTGYELSAAILHEAPKPLPKRVSAGLRAVIERCLGKLPCERYKSAKEVHAALEAVQSGTACIPQRERSGAPRRRITGRKRIRSLVVLPLANLSRDPEQEYFADGMTDVLISDLAKIQALRIISRSSAMRYKGTDKRPPEIARELDVDGVVEGSVLRAGQRVRITAQLIHAEKDTLLWAETYERDLQDVLLLQSEVARTIAKEIQVVVTAEEKRRLTAVRRVNPEAYEAYLKGRYHFYKLSRESFDTALEYFQRALEKDPNYALAYAGIADVWAARGDSGVMPAAEVIEKVRTAASKALELDEALAQVHVTLANQAFSLEWDWSGAEREFQRALQLNPNSADAHFFYSDFLITMKRPQEAEVEIKRALELDPLSFYQCFYGWHLMYQHRTGEAIAQLRKSLQIEPNFPAAHLGLWGAHSQQGMYEEAHREAKVFFELVHDQEVAEALARGYAEGGYAKAMRLGAETMAQRAKQTHVPAIRVARLYAHAGEKDRVIEWLEKAYEQRESPLIHLSVGWDWDFLRDDPRFRALLHRMKLPL